MKRWVIVSIVCLCMLCLCGCGDENYERLDGCRTMPFASDGENVYFYEVNGVTFADLVKMNISTRKKAVLDKGVVKSNIFYYNEKIYKVIEKGIYVIDINTSKKDLIRIDKLKNVIHDYGFLPSKEFYMFYCAGEVYIQFDKLYRLNDDNTIEIIDEESKSSCANNNSMYIVREYGNIYEYNVETKQFTELIPVSVWENSDDQRIKLYGNQVECKNIMYYDEKLYSIVCDASGIDGYLYSFDLNTKEIVKIDTGANPLLNFDIREGKIYCYKRYGGRVTYIDKNEEVDMQYNAYMFGIPQNRDDVILTLVTKRLNDNFRRWSYYSVIYSKNISTAVIRWPDFYNTRFFIY